MGRKNCGAASGGAEPAGRRRRPATSASRNTAKGRVSPSTPFLAAKSGSAAAFTLRRGGVVHEHRAPRQAAQLAPPASRQAVDVGQQPVGTPPRRRRPSGQRERSRSPASNRARRAVEPVAGSARGTPRRCRTPSRRGRPRAGARRAGRGRRPRRARCARGQGASSSRVVRACTSRNQAPDRAGEPPRIGGGGGVDVRVLVRRQPPWASRSTRQRSMSLSVRIPTRRPSRIRAARRTSCCAASAPRRGAACPRAP